MRQKQIAFFGLLAAAVMTAACGPTDSSISTKVRSNMTADETVKSAQIDVGVQKKVVTLSGTVDTLVVKEQALVIARRTDGVTAVIDQMTVTDQSTFPTPGPGFGHEMMEKGMKMEGRDHKEGKHN